MPVEHILSLLLEERGRLDQAIQALQGTKRRGRPPKALSAVSAAAAAPKKASGRKPRTAAQRKAQGERMKAYWAARKKAESKGK